MPAPLFDFSFTTDNHKRVLVFCNAYDGVFCAACDVYVGVGVYDAFYGDDAYDDERLGNVLFQECSNHHSQHIHLGK
jgi:hypothetical protein